MPLEDIGGAAQEAKQKVDKAACECGADALIIKSHFGTYDTGKEIEIRIGGDGPDKESVSATAIRYTDR